MKPFAAPFTVNELKDPEWRRKKTEEAIQRANDIAGGIQQVDSILYQLHHGSLDSALVGDILGVDIEIEYTMERLFEVVHSDDSKSKLYDRLNTIRSRHVPLLKHKLSDLYNGRTNDLIRLIDTQAVLARVYNEII
jgi:hypothetical protein